MIRNYGLSAKAVPEITPTTWWRLWWSGVTLEEVQAKSSEKRDIEKAVANPGSNGTKTTGR